jgi:hypothetical protein
LTSSWQANALCLTGFKVADISIVAVVRVKHKKTNNNNKNK